MARYVFQYGGIKVDPNGYWDKSNQGKPVIIPSNKITMNGVDEDLIGIDDTGYVQYMEQGNDYTFPGNTVLEMPLKQTGGFVQNDYWQNMDYSSDFSGLSDMVTQMNSIQPQEEEQPYDAVEQPQQDYNHNDSMYEELQAQIEELQSQMSTFGQQDSDSYNSDMMFDYIMNGSGGALPIDWSNAANSILPPPTAPAANIDVSSRATEAYNFFINKGYTPIQASGIVANIKHESDFRTDVPGDNGKALGLVQWHPDRRNRVFSYLQNNGLNPNDFYSQLEGIDYELNNHETGALQKLRGARTAGEAAALFDQYYERSAGKTTQDRAAYAESFLNSLNN